MKKNLFFLCLIVLVSAFTARSQNLVVSHELTIPATDVYGMDGADWCSGIATSLSTGNVYWAYIDNSRNAIIAKKDGSTGAITTQKVQADIPSDDNHSELSIGLDSNGYIHYIGGQHNNSPNYYRSTNPEDITSWEFKGNDLANGGIDGFKITYQHFFRSNNGTLFCAYRSNLVDEWVRGARSIQMGRYNTTTEKWEMLGGLNYCIKDDDCIDHCGSDLNMNAIVWDDSGSGSGKLDGSCDGCTGYNHYQGYKFKAVFDDNNVLHATWNVAKNMYTSENPAEYHSHVMYAYSPDEGNTWYRAGGQQITKLPMTCETGDTDQDATIVYKRVPDGYPNDCSSPFGLEDQTMGTQGHIVLDNSGIPIIKQYVILDDATYYFKLDGTSFVDITENFVLDNKHLFSNQNDVMFDVKGTELFYSEDNGASALTYNLEYPSDWNVYEDQYYLAKTGKLRYYAKDAGANVARIVTVTVEPGAAKPEITPSASLHTSSVEVSLSTTTEGASIRYTTDGSEPSKTHGTLYSGPFNLTSDATVKAMAYTSEFERSNVAQKSYYVMDDCLSKLTISGVEASGYQDPNVPANSYDNNFDTRWSAEGEHWIKYDLGAQYYISNIFISFYHGDARIANLTSVETSVDGNSWTEVLGSSYSSGKTSDLEKFPLQLSQGRYVRVNCNGTNTSGWNSLQEVQIWGDCENPLVYQYDLTTVVEGEGSITLNPTGGTYDQATSVECEAIPASLDYVFDGWSGAIDSKENPVTLTMTSDKSITANFKYRPPGSEIIITAAGKANTELMELYLNDTLKASYFNVGGDYWDDEWVTYSYYPGEFVDAEDIKLKFANNSNERGIWVRDIKLDNVVYPTEFATNLTNLDYVGCGNHYSKFMACGGESHYNQNTLPWYTIDLTVIGNGTVVDNLGNDDPPVDSLPKDKKFQYIATPDLGFQFDGWTGDEVNTNERVTIKADANKSVTATFSPLPNGDWYEFTENSYANYFDGTTYLAGDMVWDFNTYGGQEISQNDHLIVNNAGNQWSEFSNHFVDKVVDVSDNPVLTFQLKADETTSTTHDTANYTVILYASDGSLTYGQYKLAIPIDGQWHTYAYDISNSWANLDSINQIKFDYQDGNNNIFHLYMDSLMLGTTGGNLFTLTTEAMPANTGSVTPSGSGFYKENTNVDVTANDVTGYAFDHWTGDLGGANSADNPVSITMDADKSLTANFAEVDTFTITTNKSGGDGTGTITFAPDATAYNSGTEVDIEASISTLGYAFDYWSGDVPPANINDNPVTITMDANKVITANFKTSPVYNLTTTANGDGSIVLDPSGGEYIENTTVTATADPDNGKLFDGWSGAASGKELSTSVEMTSNKSLTADFIAPEILSTSSSITIDGTKESAWNGGVGYLENVTTGSVSNNDDLSAAWTALWDNNNLYVFVDVVDDVIKNDDASTWKDDVVEIYIDADHSQATSYDANDFQYAFRADNVLSENKHDSTRNVEYSITTTTDGYHVEVKFPWATLLGVTPSANDTIGFDVQVNDDDDGGGRDGKKAWYGTTDVAWDDPSTFASIPLVTSGAAPSTYTLTTSADPTAGGTVSPSGSNDYDEDTDVEVIATANTGYNFDGWDGASTETNDTITVTMDADKSLTAQFSLKTYTLTTGVNNSSYGSVSVDPDQASYDHGTEVTVIATPASGYQFDDWTGSSETNDTITITMDANKNITANFLLDDVYTLTSTVNGNGAIELDPSGGEYVNGTTVTATADPDNGKLFDGWSGAASGKELSTSVEMTSNKSLTADFIAPEILSTSSSITIDGTKESAWNGGVGYLENVTTGSVSNNDDLSAAWTALWDNNNLYVFVDVVDDVIKNDDASTWKDDAVEIYIDADNSKATTYDANDFQYAFRADNVLSENKHDSTRNVEYSITTTNDGYHVEVKFPWATLLGVTPSANDTIGFDVQVNDDDDGGGRDGKKAWYGTTDVAWDDPSTFASIPLVTSGAAPSTYTLTTSADPTAGGTVSPSGSNDYDEDTDVEVIATANTGYNFDGWDGASTETNNTITVTMDADKSLTAQFSLKTYTLTTDVNNSSYGSVSVDPDQTSYDHGTEVTIIATPASGYQFDDWTGSSETNDTITITMDSDKSITANFSTEETETNLALNKDVTFSGFQSPNDNLVDGDISDGSRWSQNTFPEWAEVDLGQDCNITKFEVYPYQDRAYQYKIEVKPDGGSYSQVVDRLSNTTGGNIIMDEVTTSGRYVKITVEGASGYTGSWVSLNELMVFGTTGATPSTYTLTTSADPTDGGSVSPSGSNDYDEDTDVEVIATANTGYNFDGWDGASTETNDTITVTMDADKSLTANFSAILVSSITIPEGDQSKTVGDADFTLTVDVSPSDALDKTVSWASDNESVATVTSGGMVSVIAAGTANITAMANDGSGASASIEVTVTEGGTDPWYDLTATYYGNYFTGTTVNSTDFTWHADGSEWTGITFASNDELIITNAGKTWSRITNTFATGTSVDISGNPIVSFKAKTDATQNITYELRLEDSNGDNSFATYTVTIEPNGGAYKEYKVTVGDVYNFNTNSVQEVQLYYGDQTSHTNTLWIDDFEMGGDNKSINTLLASGQEATIKLYPNPTSSNAGLNIVLKGFENETEATISIMDISGRIAYSTNVQTMDRSVVEQTLNTNGLSGGMYMVVVRGSNKVINQRLIIR